MADRFRTKIQQSLSDPNLQIALDGNAERRKIARNTAYKTLPEDLQVLRQRAHEVRARTIAELDTFLEDFISQVEENGTTVHWAQDAAQARQIVLNIAAQNQSRLVVKSKTMVGEEIEINTALEREGIEVIETDLGEYIVQLRGEPPAHIITPAVHLRREDVAQTFKDRLKVPYDDSVQVMTETARHILRRAFFKADIGISGINFGVVESGTLCIVANEGNARLVTTLPPVHIALMGIERLVPTMDDLALMLYLLPRSATGQKLTVYTSLLHGPRHPDEIDGPQQRHLVLVDNGRNELRKSTLAEILLCIRCGACINACPVFREIGGHAYLSKDGETTPYPGPIGSVISPGLFGQAEFGHLARASSLCGACREVCPVDIDLPKLLLRVRAGHTPVTSTKEQPANGVPSSNAPRSLRVGLRIYSWLARSPRRFAAAQQLAGIGSRLIAPFSEWIRLPALTGWGSSRDFPRPARQPFRARARELIENNTPISGEPKTNPHNSRLDNTRSEISAPVPPVTQSLVNRFRSELESLGGTLIQCEENEVPHQVINFLQEKGVTSIQTWDGSYLPAGLLEALRENGIRTQLEPDEGIAAGMTGALAGAAETATLVLPTGVGMPLTASLLPELHLAILYSRDIYEDLAQVLSLPEVKDSSSTVLISGPSRTADIEMTLTIGVHGPREVLVFCIE